MDKPADTFYFGINSSSWSWAGNLDSDEDMPEDEVIKYIKNAKPNLIEKLGGMLISSYHVPFSFHGQRSLQRINQMEISNRVPYEHFERHMHLLPPRGESTHETSKLWTNLRSKDACYTLCGQDAEKHGLLHKNADSLLIANNLAKVTCSFRYSRSACDEKVGTPPDGIHSRSSICATSGQSQLLLDGIDRLSVLDAASRLYQPLDPSRLDHKAQFDDRGRPDHAFNYPTNSCRAQQLRSHKQYEMGKTLAEVERYEKAANLARQQQYRSRIRSSSPEPSMFLSPPFFMERRSDRYKKQGLAYNEENKVLKNGHSRRVRVKGTNEALLGSVTEPFADLFEIICYCRDSEDGGETLKCSAERCPIGWFHLRCTALDRLPIIGEQFFCRYCSDCDHDVITGLPDDLKIQIDPTTEIPLTVDAQIISPDQGISLQETDEEREDDEASNLFRPTISRRSKSNDRRINKWCAINHHSSSPYLESLYCNSRSESVLTHMSNESDYKTTIHNSSFCSSNVEDSGTGLVSCSKALNNTDNTKFSSPDTTSDHSNNDTVKTSQIINTGTIAGLSRRSNSSSSADRPNTSPRRTIVTSTPTAPSTPIHMPAYQSSVPWGTPVNMSSLGLRNTFEEGLDIGIEVVAEPVSPSPAPSKRRNDYHYVVQ